MYQLEEKISLEIVKIPIINQNDLVLNQLPLENVDRIFLIQAIGEFTFATGSTLRTVGDVYNNDVIDPIAQSAIKSMIKILNKHFEKNEEINITADFESAYESLIIQIKKEFQNSNVNHVMQTGEFRIVFIPNNELNDKSQILIDDIDTFLDLLNPDERDIICYSWGYTKLAESIQKISSRYPNLNITKIKKDLDSRLYSSLTEQSKNFLSTVRQNMIQDLSQHPNLNNLFEQFTEHPEDASEIQVTKFYEFVDLFSSDKLRQVRPIETGQGGNGGDNIPMSVQVENLLKKEDRSFTKREISLHLATNRQITFNDNVYACEINAGTKGYRHVQWLKADIEAEGLYFDDVIFDILNKLKNYFNDNLQIKSFNHNNQQYKVLHLQEYFSKTINESLQNADSYYGLPNSVNYYALLSLVERFIKNHGLFYDGSVENITNHPNLNEVWQEKITVPRLIIRTLDASVRPMTRDELSEKLQRNINWNRKITDLLILTQDGYTT
jgi:hypothetical protein